MNTEIRKVIEKIENSQKELERLVQERTVIMKNERHLSVGNYRRELAIIENFIRRKSEEIVNDRKTVEEYTHASDLMKEINLAPGSEEERAEKEEELSSVMESLPSELQQELIERVNSKNKEENALPTNITKDESIPKETSNEERLITLQEALEVAKNSYLASINNFQNIFANEKNEIAERGPITEEELEELNSRYFRAKEEENERLQRSRELVNEIESKINDLNTLIEEEKNNVIAKATEESQSVEKTTPNENEKDSLSQLKKELLEKKQSGEIDTNEMIRRIQEAAGNLAKSEEYHEIPKDKSLVPVIGKEDGYKPIPEDKALVPVVQDDEYKPIPEDKALVPVVQESKQEEKNPRGFYTIINELTEGLNVQAKTGKKYKASNIKVSKEFKEELKSGNYLYNIVHLVPAIIKVPIKLIRKAINRIKYSIEEKKTVATLKERISNLSEEDLKVIWDEYRGTKVIEERYPDILNILLNEKMQQYAMEKVTALNNSMEEKYKELFTSKQIVDKCNEILSEVNTDNDQELVKEIIEKRENAIAGKAEMIKQLREEYKEANSWISGGSHGFEEDMKAATTKLSIIGKRFVKEQNLDPEITKKQAEIEQKEMAAIRNNDDESALNAFIENEVLLSSNTQFEQSVFGTRSSGAKYYEPVIVKSDYSDDPFVRDLFTTVAVTAATINAVSAVNVHGTQADEILKANKDQVKNANEYVNNVREESAKLVDNSNDFADGMQAQANSNIINNAHTMERQSLDQTSWQLGTTEYKAYDSAAHEAYNSMADTVQTQINDIANQYSLGLIDKSSALDLLKDVANDSHQNLVDLYESYLPTLKEYASSHPQFDLHGVEDAMEFVVSHPGAIAKMNEGMVESIQIGENLQALSNVSIEAINSLPSDLRTTLFADGAAAVALAYNVSKDMNKNEKKGKYGNSVTDMVSEYIANKESASVETNTSAKSK